jgi:hypothetical protein
MPDHLSSELLEKAFDKGTDEQRKKLFLLLAAKCELLETRPLAPPVILIPGREWPTQEQIRKAQARGAPVIRVQFVEAKHGHDKGTSAAKGA